MTTSSISCTTIGVTTLYHLRKPVDGLWACGPGTNNGFTYDEIQGTVSCSTAGVSPELIIEIAGGWVMGLGRADRMTLFAGESGGELSVVGARKWVYLGGIVGGASIEEALWLWKSVKLGQASTMNINPDLLLLPEFFFSMIPKL